MIIDLRHLKRNKRRTEYLKISEKYCKRCDNTKEINKFAKSSESKDGYVHYCKECFKEISRKTYYGNKFKIFEREQGLAR